MDSKQYKACLVEDIKCMATMISDNAEDIVGDMDHMATLKITIDFAGDGTVPVIRVTKEYLPSYTVLNAITQHRLEQKHINLNKDLVTSLHKTEDKNDT